MKIQIEVNPNIEETKVVIECSELNEQILELQRLLQAVQGHKQQILYYQGDIEYFHSEDQILFFESNEYGVSAHTEIEMYAVKHKLYELEEYLPTYFCRISKTTIVNVRKVKSITRNITSSSMVEFNHSHKTVYVSRHYYKVLKDKIIERR